MRKKIILGLIIAVSTFHSTHSLAATDAQYPAANFQPSVIYIDKDVTAQSAKDDKYPAANFQPKVIYSDNSVVSQSSSSASSQAAEPYDPKYPAAYFKPKVIYP
jgi:L-fucose mutarotase/ribose pyranase (RbsD/FucU family)